jgi:hypothetical protein
MRGWIFLATLAVTGSPVLAKSPTPLAPLFASDTPIRATIQGPFSVLAINRAETPRPGAMTVDGVTYPITLTPRGITRKTSDICDFPPLRVELTTKAPPGSLFEHQHHLKLVTHCKRDAAFQQKVLLEYSAYRLYNMMTQQSFRARLATIDYVDANGRPYVSRVGYFIEDFDDVAKRNGMTNAHMGSLVPMQQIDATAGARFAVFEYMISNYDWAMVAALKGEECCHNARLMSASAGAPLMPVPYDFDFSGLVDAPYSVQPDGVPIESVRQRLYRGYCSHLPQARAIAAELLPRRAEFTRAFTSIPGLDAHNQAHAAAYIDGFFNDVASGKIFKNCMR